MILFKMTNIEVEQFAILQEKMPEGEVQLRVSIQSGASKDKHLVTSRINATYIQEERPVLTVQGVCSFDIEEKSWESFAKDGKTVIHREFLAHCAMLAFGTLRGVLYAKTEKESIGKVILPLTNVDQIIKEDLVV